MSRQVSYYDSNTGNLMQTVVPNELADKLFGQSVTKFHLGVTSNRLNATNHPALRGIEHLPIAQQFEYTNYKVSSGNLAPVPSCPI